MASSLPCGRSAEPTRWMGWRGRVPVLGDPNFPLAAAAFHVTNRAATAERLGWASQAVPVGPPLPGVRVEDGIQMCWVKPVSAVGDVLPHLHRDDHAAVLVDDYELQGGSPQDPFYRRHARHERPGFNTSNGSRADADASRELALAQICNTADAANHPGQHRCQRAGLYIGLLVVRRTHIPRIGVTTARFDPSREPVVDRSPVWINAAIPRGPTLAAPRRPGYVRSRLPLLCLPIRSG